MQNALCLCKNVAFVCTRNSVFYSPVMALTALAEEFRRGAMIRLLSDMLSFSSHCGSTESPHHLYDVLFFLLPSSVSPAFFHSSVILFLSVALKEFFFFFFTPFLTRPLLFQTSIKVFICNAKILITGILRSLQNHNSKSLQLELLPSSL